MHNRPEWLETLFGTWKAKALPFNVNYRYVDEEFRQLMELAQPSAIVYEARFAEQVDRYRRVTEPSCYCCRYQTRRTMPY
jgi:fatty-acyl-CoA synthase